MAFVQALSGLYSSSIGLDTISSNIANASTAGYKRSRAELSDIFESRLKNGVGHGALAPSVEQQFTQGSFKTTNNDLDFSINGNGMFRVVDGLTGTTSNVAYTRNGEFRYALGPTTTGTASAERYIQNAQGNYLTGWAEGVATTATPEPIRLVASMAANATSTSSMRVNLDDRAALIPATKTFSATDPTSFNWSTSQQVFSGVDGDTTPHNLTLYFARQPSATDPTLKSNNWSVYAFLDGQAAGGPQTLSFDAQGKLTAGNALAVSGSVNATVLTVSGQTGAVTSSTTTPTALSIALDLSNSSQFASGYDLGSSIQDGYKDGFLASTSLEPDGTLVGRYSNSQTQNMGRVALATFINPNGLKSIGDNLWQETSYSGTAAIGAAGSGGRGVMNDYSLEESNVDLADELVNMIIMQRNYQANAQTIKTQDEMLRNLAGLR